MLIYLKFVIFFTLLSTSLHAEILQKVQIRGNSRTKESAILQHGQIKLFQDLSGSDLETIKNNLGRIGQIKINKIDFNNGILAVDIEEKWTVFPVPMITESGNYQNRGLLIYEDNFIGTLGTAAAGVSWTNSILNALFYYQDESLFSARTGIKILAMKKSDYADFKRHNQSINIHESRYNMLMVTPNILIKDHVLKAGPFFINKKIFSGLGQQLFDDKSKGLFFRHHLNGYRTLEVMYEGVVTTYDLYLLKNKNKDTIVRHEADARWSLPLNENFLNIGLHGHHINDQSFLFPKYLGGDEGYRGYDKASLPARHNLGTLIQYQQHLKHQIYLTPFYEFNSSRLITPLLSGQRLNDHTLGAGIRYYFKKISIPAVMFDYARNITDNSDHFHFNVGLSL